MDLAKSIKFKNNVLIDTTGITHGGNGLQHYLNGTLGLYDRYEVGASFNLDDLPVGQTCFWNTSDVPSNAPCKGGRCYCFRQYAHFRFQIALFYNDTRIYLRRQWSNTWSDWRQI